MNRAIFAASGEMAGSKVHQLKRLVSLNLARSVQRLVQEGVSLRHGVNVEVVL